MKKNIILVIIILIIIFSGCSTTGEEVYSLQISNSTKKYEVYRKYYDNIENSLYLIGTIFNDSGSIHNKNIEKVSINKVVAEDNSYFYFVRLEVFATNEQNIEEFKIKMDKELFILPGLVTILDDILFEEETDIKIFDFELSEDLINKILDASKIKMQYFNSPVTFDNLQIAIIKSFLKDSLKYDYENNWYEITH